MIFTRILMIVVLIALSAHVLADWEKKHIEGRLPTMTLNAHSGNVKNPVLLPYMEITCHENQGLEFALGFLGHSKFEADGVDRRFTTSNSKYKALHLMYNNGATQSYNMGLEVRSIGKLNRSKLLGNLTTEMYENMIVSSLLRITVKHNFSNIVADFDLTGFKETLTNWKECPNPATVN